MVAALYCRRVLSVQFRPRCTPRTSNSAYANGLGVPYVTESISGCYKFKTSPPWAVLGIQIQATLRS